MHDRNDLLYWAFLESTRQVAVFNETLALNLLRTWHAFQIHQTYAIQKKINEAHAKTMKVKQTFSSVLQNYKDMKFE
jgi:hypothetical protein